MLVAEAVGRALVAAGVDHVFGVVGSGNFHVTNALVRHGVPFVAARHEGGAVTMADAYARMSGTVGVVSVHQGPGLTNAITEGFNLKAKLVKRRAFGYRSFRNYRLRLLNACAS